jgi:hypothetical protein
MKTFLKRSALVCGLLITALICMGIVYIDTTSNSWRVRAGANDPGNFYVQLLVSNNVAMWFRTNNGSMGIGSADQLNGFAVEIVGVPGGTNATGNGVNRSSAGAVSIAGGLGGNTTANNANGGTGGQMILSGGTGGDSSGSTTNANGGAGGTFIMGGGNGGNPTALATNSLTGGNGGSANFAGGSGATPPGTGGFATTNAVSGNGGAANINGGSSSTPTLGWSRKSGNGGAVNIAGGSAGLNAVRTNGASGGAVNITGADGGSVATATGSGGSPGAVNITAGNGANGNGGTNSDGANIYVRGGTPGSSAVPGNIYLGRISSGAGNGGGVVIGISNSAVLTNVVFVRTNLDFPSTLTGASSDLVAVAITGRTNAIVNVGVPPSALVPAGIYTAFCSNGIVFARFTFVGAVSADPVAGDFEIEVKAYR